MAETLDAKMIQKRSTTPGEVPTIPATSEDHTDGTWSITDLYSAEFFVNEADKRIFIRIDDEIKELVLAGAGGIKKKKFVLDPAGLGQSVFTLDSDILGDYEIFVDGILYSGASSKTDTDEITTTATIPAGSEVVIIY